MSEKGISTVSILIHLSRRFFHLIPPFSFLGYPVEYHVFEFLTLDYDAHAQDHAHDWEIRIDIVLFFNEFVLLCN